EHLALALVRQEESVVPALLGKLGVNAANFEAEMKRGVEHLAKVAGGSQPAFSRDTDAVIRQAEKEAAAMKDDYVSTEHLFLALSDKAVLKGQGIQRSAVLAALGELRGHARVTDQEPESKFQALDKYARDLTQLARQGKLDPV